MFQRLLSMFQRAVINLLEDMEYNANKVVAAIIPSDGSDEHSNHRDIFLHLSGSDLSQSALQTQACIMFCFFFLLERMVSTMTFHYNLDLRGSEEVIRLAKDPTMHIIFIHGLECNQHYFHCFNNVWLILRL